MRRLDAAFNLDGFAVKLAPETGAIREGFWLRQVGMHASNFWFAFGELRNFVRFALSVTAFHSTLTPRTIFRSGKRERRR